MNDKQIIIIGAGIAGLSAGCYGLMNGYKVHIFEQNTSPGGLCTSWDRKGFIINGGLAFLGGSGPGTDFYQIWKELGVVPGIQMIDFDYFIIVEGEGNKTFYLHTNLAKLEKHMQDLAPEDENLIQEFISGIKLFTNYQVPVEKAQELYTPWDKMKFVFTRFPLIRAIAKWKKVTIKQFADRFKNPFLRDALLQAKAIFSDDLPLLAFQMFLAWGHLRSAGFPEGGGLRLSKAIEKRFLELGGRIYYESCVSKILVKKGYACGIRLENGSEHSSDHVISASDLRKTVFDMLEGQYINAEIQGYFDHLPVASSVVMVALGLSREFSELPSTAVGIVYPLNSPMTIAGKEVKYLRPMIYNFDGTLAPEGKTLLRVVLPADYDYWKALGENQTQYEKEKDDVLEKVINLLEQRFPGISSQVEMSDVATPLTLEHHTGNWRGSTVGWDATTQTFLKSITKILPGLQNFWMAGQWVEPGGGVPMAALSGRNIIQLIVKKDKKPFLTTVP
ncbi:MAG: NAD(P)/FAD-dependent oxidoreductase [Candidatus Aminicenantes bacterium]|nr:NAD(P)/FAD-dependent oxidoreductase [Candidatus Aminicenantes bacterium]